MGGTYDLTFGGHDEIRHSSNFDERGRADRHREFASEFGSWDTDHTYNQTSPSAFTLPSRLPTTSLF
jgi:hypothetical protein